MDLLKSFGVGTMQQPQKRKATDVATVPQKKACLAPKSTLSNAERNMAIKSNIEKEELKKRKYQEYMQKPAPPSSSVYSNTSICSVYQPKNFISWKIPKIPRKDVSAEPQTSAMPPERKRKRMEIDTKTITAKNSRNQSREPSACSPKKPKRPSTTVSRPKKPTVAADVAPKNCDIPDAWSWRPAHSATVIPKRPDSCDAPSRLPATFPISDLVEPTWGADVTFPPLIKVTADSSAEEEVSKTSWPASYHNNKLKHMVYTAEDGTIPVYGPIGSISYRVHVKTTARVK